MSLIYPNEVAAPRSNKPGRGRARRRAVSLLLTGIMVGALGILGGQSAQAIPVGSMCAADQIMIGVRGTDATGGVGTEEDGRVYASGGFGPQLSSLAGYADADGFKTWARAINYPASGGLLYNSSVDDGVAKLIAVLNSTLRCSLPPLIFVTGHSQGADVVLHALANPSLKKEVIGNIKAVAVFGDPQWTGGVNYNYLPPKATGYGILGARPSYETYALENTFWVYGYPPEGTGQAWMSRIRSYCYANDWACQNLLLNDSTNATHNSYKAEAYNVWQWMVRLSEW